VDEQKQAPIAARFRLLVFRSVARISEIRGAGCGLLLVSTEIRALRFSPGSHVIE
jgi:hypothetical protein